jgi:hypothetical protein
MQGKTQTSAQTGQSNAGKAQVVRNEAFVKHLEHASGVVQTWPVWKQELLGGKATPPSTGSAKAVSR